MGKSALVRFCGLLFPGASLMFASDVDECENPSICPVGSRCEDSIGSYSCQCGPGYELSEALTCIGELCADSCHTCFADVDFIAL